MIAACTMVRNWVRRNRVFALARLHHIDGHELLLGVDPEGRAGGARPAMFAHRALDRRITQPRVDLEAQAETEAVLSARPGVEAGETSWIPDMPTGAALTMSLWA